MGEVVDFKAKVKQAQEKDLETLPLPSDEDLATFAYVLSFIRALSTSETAEVRISDDTLYIDIKHFVDSEEGLHDVQSGTIMIGSSVGEIANDEGELYDIDVLKDIIKEMLTKVQL